MIPVFQAVQVDRFRSSKNFILFNFADCLFFAFFQVSKAIMFGTKQRFLQAFAVDAAWIVFGNIGLVLATMFKRKQAIKEKERKAQNKGE